MKMVKLLGLALIAAMALVATAATDGIFGGTLPSSSSEEAWALLAVSLCALGAMVLRIRKTPQFSTTRLAHSHITVSTNQLAEKAWTATASDNSGSQLIAQIKSQLSNSGYDRKKRTIKPVMAC